MPFLQKFFFLIIGLLTGRPAQEGGATGAAAAGNSLAFYGALAGFGAWLIGPGRDIEITLRGWEIWAVLLVGAILGALFLHIKPPGPPQ